MSRTPKETTTGTTTPNAILMGNNTGHISSMNSNPSTPNSSNLVGFKDGNGMLPYSSGTTERQRRPHTILTPEEVGAGKDTNWTEIEITG